MNKVGNATVEMRIESFRMAAMITTCEHDLHHPTVDGPTDFRLQALKESLFGQRRRRGISEGLTFG
jgi:hypothetical protein